MARARMGKRLTCLLVAEGVGSGLGKPAERKEI